ncbi:hypothetical protein BHS06_23275 [Myxococcus xanthus]|uniref:hypothetical protein n=1 Tax=Myxococcus xanthus TaxID=34 RepID=UPI00112DE693|nr:hypothetical protein [Myxococcus xanthus]QDE91663.1 hypothetical protein BHS06_23275 [Myxococcus xanthus]
MTNPASDLTFRERMSGPLAMGATDPMKGATQGNAARFTMHCTISVDDLDAFTRDAAHTARLEARVSYPPLGKELPVQQGHFNLFRNAEEPGTKLMSYGLRFSAKGREYFLEGTKTLRDEPGFDLWRDTTRLYCYLHEGPDARSPVVGAGVLMLGKRALVELLGSMRSSRHGTAGFGAVSHFGRFFLGTLWNVYAPWARQAAEAPSAPSMERSL